MSELDTPRKINAAIRQYVLSNKGFPVYARDSAIMTSSDWVRITAARTRNGMLEVKSLATGTWFQPAEIERR